MSDGYLYGGACAQIGRYGTVTGWVAENRKFVCKNGRQSGSLGYRQKHKPGLGRGVFVWL